MENEFDRDDRGVCSDVIFFDVPVRQNHITFSNEDRSQRLSGQARRMEFGQAKSMMELKRAADRLLADERTAAHASKEAMRVEIAAQREAAAAMPGRNGRPKRRRQRQGGALPHRQRRNERFTRSINKKRETVSHLLQHSTFSSFSSLAKAAGCSVATAKLHHGLRALFGAVPQFTPTNMHSQESVAQLAATIRNPTNAYASAGDLKRIHPRFSKKFIRRKLKETGRKYILSSHSKSKHVPSFKPSDLTPILHKSLFAYEAPAGMFFWFDVTTFSLRRLEKRRWRNPNDQIPDPVAPRDNRSIHMLAICTKDAFFAIQFCLVPPNGRIVEEFLTSVLNKLPNRTPTAIFLDNSQANLAGTSNQPLSHLVIRNVPRGWVFNLVELPFSTIKSAWERRQNFGSIEAYAFYIADFIQRNNTTESFAGYRRKYLAEISKHLGKAIEKERERNMLINEDDRGDDPIYYGD